MEPTFMPSEQFDSLIKSLDDPDSAPHLEDLAEMPMPYTKEK